MIILGLGSNLKSTYGDRFKNLSLALSSLESNKIQILLKSSLYETPSYPNDKDPKFINMVIGISTNLKPSELAGVAISVEESLERKRNYKNEPRTCDIDIIDYNGQIIEFKYKNLNYNIPHVNLAYRNFVLIPLKEILPEWKHPKTKEPIDSIIDKLSDIDKKSILKIKKP